ncbi:MAG: hypothetical protein NTX79_00815 [Candidatus Micrarchaeota archaeon]|nr:hypothetical protein [Candidatus Micrarchaeota archaeon]
MGSDADSQWQHEYQKSLLAELRSALKPYDNQATYRFVKDLEGRLSSRAMDSITLSFLLTLVKSDAWKEHLSKSPALVFSSIKKMINSAGENATQAIIFSYESYSLIDTILQNPVEIGTIARFTEKGIRSIDLSDPLLFRLYCDILHSSEIDDQGKKAIFRSSRLQSRLDDNAFMPQGFALKHKLFSVMDLYEQEKKLYQEYTKKYGVRPMRIAGFLDGKRGERDGDLTFKVELKTTSKIMDVAKKLKFDQAFFAAAIYQEGFVNVIRSLDSRSFWDHEKNNERPFALESFEALGVDSFYKSVKKLKGIGYLRADFTEGVDYRRGSGTVRSEDNSQVEFVYFKDTNAMIEAFGAMLAYSRDMFLKCAGNRVLSDDQIAVGTYFFYNTGGVSPNDLNVGNLSEKKARLVAGFYKIIKQPGGSFRFDGNISNTRNDSKNPEFNYTRVLATIKFLKDAGVPKEAFRTSNRRIVLN